MSLIAIFSDLHDNLNNLNLFLLKAQKEKVAALFFLGDLSSPKTLKYLCSKWKKPIYLVGGNADFFETSLTNKYPQLIYQVNYLDFFYENLHLLLVHKPTDLKNLLTINPVYDFAFYGHTHTPWIENKNSVIIANPGNLKDNLGQATYALLNTKNSDLKLKRLTD